MRVKILAQNRFQIVAIMKGKACPVEDFISFGEFTTKANRVGLLNMLEDTAKVGLDNIPAAWTHEANKKEKIYEFIKGRLRLYFFKGHEEEIVVCTSGQLKKTDKANKAVIEEAARYRKEYFEALNKDTLQVMKNET